MDVAADQKTEEQIATVYSQVRSLLKEAYELARDNPGEFKDSNVHVHIGSILTKFVREERPAAEKETQQGNRYRTFKPTADDFKKKSKPALAVAADEPDADDPLLQMTLPELKVKAKQLGIMYSNKSAKQLIMEIYHHEKHLLAERKSKFKKDQLAEANELNLTSTDKLVIEDDEDFTPSVQIPKPTEKQPAQKTGQTVSDKTAETETTGGAPDSLSNVDELIEESKKIQSTIEPTENNQSLIDD